MLTKLVLFVGMALGSSLTTASTTQQAKPEEMMSQPAELEPAGSCLPRGSGCDHDHDCCSRICRLIKGSKSCS